MPAAPINRNVAAMYAGIAFLGLAESIFAVTLLPVWLYIISDNSNEKVGLVEAANGIASLVTALPVGYFADKIGRSVLVKSGSAVMIGNAFFMSFLIYNPFNYQLPVLLPCFVAGMSIWGITGGVMSGPGQALFAESVAEGERSRAYMLLQLYYLIPAIIGPILAIFLIMHYGDDWTLDQLRPIMIVGIMLEVPSGLLFAMMDDKASLKDPYAAEPATVAPESPAAASDDVERAASPLNDDSKASLLTPKSKRVYTMRVPLTLFLSDLLIAFGAGMTVKFFPLFFKQDMHLTPIGVQLATLAATISMAVFSVIVTLLGKCLGRVQTVFLANSTGIACLTMMSVLISHGYNQWYAILPFYVVRTGLMQASILMEFVPKEQRARWKSLESVGQVGWCGSALLGGILSDKYDYTSTFLITVGIQAVATLVYATLLGVVPREAPPEEDEKPKDLLSKHADDELAAPLL